MNNYYLGFQDGHLHLQAKEDGSFAMMHFRIRDQEAVAHMTVFYATGEDPSWRGKVEIRAHSRNNVTPFQSASLFGADRDVVASFLSTLVLGWVRSMQAGR